jgi:hypothetical protein
MKTATLPEHWSKFLLTQPETGTDYQIVAVTLRDGCIKAQNAGAFTYEEAGFIGGCARRGSNAQPTAPEAVALSN